MAHSRVCMLSEALGLHAQTACCYWTTDAMVLQTNRVQQEALYVQAQMLC